MVRQKNINFFQRQAAADRNYERRRARQAASKRRLKLSSSKAAGSEATEAYASHPPTPSCQDSSFTGGYVERRRTTENEVRVGRVLARRGWEGEKDAVSAAARSLL